MKPECPSQALITHSTWNTSSLNDLNLKDPPQLEWSHQPKWPSKHEYLQPEWPSSLNDSFLKEKASELLYFGTHSTIVVTFVFVAKLMEGPAPVACIRTQNG